MKIMVAYDGTLQAKEALVYGMDKAREKGGEVVALQVFNNGMFVDYDASVDAEAMARGEYARHAKEAVALIHEKGASAFTRFYTTDGNPEEEVVAFAKEKKVDVLLCPPKFKGIISKYRASVTSTEIGSESGNCAVLSVKAM